MKLNIQLFAVTKTTTFSESNLDVVNNTSTLKITIYFSANNSSTWFSSETLYCTCNGVTQSAKVAHPKGGSTTKAFTFNNIQHNADGTKTVSWSWNCNTGTSVLGNVSSSGTKKLTDLHKPPEINSYTITETNQALIDAGISNDMFVANLSQKSVNISYTLYDNATLTRATAFDHTTPYSNASLPILMDFTQNALVLNASKETGILGVPFLVRVEDSLNGLKYFTNKYGNFSESPSSGEYRDFYSYIPYIPVSFTSTTKAKRVGQLSGQVALDVEGTYYNDAVGSANQGNTYSQTADEEFESGKNYYILNDGQYLLLEAGVDYHIGDDIGTYFDTVYEVSGGYKPTIKYKYWKYGDSEPQTYANTISSSDISINNGVFSVSSLDIGSTTETDPDYFDPQYAYRIKLYVEDNFTNVESNELSVTIGEATWTEYPDRVDFKKLTLKNSIDLYDTLFYKPGDVIELGATDAKALTVDGFISDSSRQLLMSIPVPKRLDNITTITVTSVNVEARGHEGYLNNVSGYNEYVGVAGYTMYVDKSSENTIRLRIAKSTAWTKSGGGSTSNNVTISLNGYFKFELS